MVGSLINQKIGRYQVLSLLGRGGMAVVYRAHDTLLERDVALKVLYAHDEADQSQIARFRREAITAASLDHPHIVPVYDVGDHEDLIFIAMKLLGGRSLQAVLHDRGTLSLAELLPILQAIAEALDYAHARGVVHRDIKPGNILLDGGLERAIQQGAGVTLTDFGIAKLLDAPGLTTTGALIGTPDYMAPEQIGGRNVDRRTDIYALGMLAFRALIGHPAFRGSPQAILLAHLYNPPPLPSSLNATLPPAVDAALLCALAKDPAERFTAAQEFVAALQGSAMTTATPAPPTTQPYAPSPRSDPRIAGSAATTLNAEHAAAAPITPVIAVRSAPPHWLIGFAVVAVLLIAIGVGMLGLLVLRTVPSQTPTLRAGGPQPSPSLALPTIAPAPTVNLPPIAPTLSPTPAIVTIIVTAPPLIITATPKPTTPPPPTVPPASPTATNPPPPPPTPSATPTEPTATPSASPTITPSQTPCPQPAARGFGKIYAEQPSVRQRLGCALSGEQIGTGSIEQYFDQGAMFYWSSTDTIYVFLGLEGGDYMIYPPAQVVALPEPTPEANDPLAPNGGFARIYYGVPAIHAALGGTFTALRVIEPYGVTQIFEGGRMIFTPSYRDGQGKSIWVLYNSGAFERYVDTFPD